MLTYKIQGTDRLLNSLERLDLSFKDFRPLFNEASRLVYEFEKDAFASEGSTSKVGRWKPLTRAYAQWKEKKAPGKPILELTGTLKRSLTRPNARGSVRRVTEDELTIGTSIPYGIFHQTGTRKMVARPPFAQTKQQERQIVKILRDGIAAFVKRAGFTVTEGRG